MHILILNDNPLHAAFLKKALRYESIGVDTCRLENIKAIWYGQYDAIVASLEEWTIHRYKAITEILKDLGDIPTLLTAKGRPPRFFEKEQEDNPHLVVVGTHLPFHEFLQTLRKLVGKKEKEILPNSILKIGELFIDLEAHEVKRKKIVVKLRHREFNLLICLAQNANRTLTRTYLLETVWDRNISMMSNTVDVHIARLRKKIDNPYEKKYIHTIPQVGYKLAIR